MAVLVDWWISFTSMKHLILELWIMHNSVRAEGWHLCMHGARMRQTHIPEHAGNMTATGGCVSEVAAAVVTPCFFVSLFLFCLGFFAGILGIHLKKPKCLQSSSFLFQCLSDPGHVLHHSSSRDNRFLCEFWWRPRLRSERLSARGTITTVSDANHRSRKEETLSFNPFVIVVEN